MNVPLLRAEGIIVNEDKTEILVQCDFIRTNTASLVETSLLFNMTRKLESELTVLETLFAPIAECTGNPISNIVGKLISPPPPTNVPTTLPIIPIIKKMTNSIEQPTFKITP